MKHAVPFFTKLIVLASILIGIGAKAQTPYDPPTVNLIMSPRPSPFLSDWQSRRETAIFSATLSQPINQPVKLMAQVSLNGQIVARTKQEKMPMLTLHQGQNLFYGDRIIPFNAVSFSGNIDGVSQRLGRLPEGNYDICVWFVDAERGTPIGSSSCGNFTIRDVEPPTLISPATGAKFSGNILNANRIETVSKNETVTNTVPVTLSQLAGMNTQSLRNLKSFDLGTEGQHFYYASNYLKMDGVDGEFFEYIPYNRYELEHAMISSYYISNGGPDNPKENVTINFSWIPPMPTPPVQVKYRLRVVPVYPGQIPNSAITSALSKDVMLIGRLSADLNMDGIADIIRANITRTHQFAWAVQALDASGNSIGKNNGWSEVWMFDVGNPDFDLLRKKAGESTLKINKADVGSKNTNVNLNGGRCPYAYKKLIRKFFTSCKDGYKTLYYEYEVFHCLMPKGHSGPHEGTSETVFISFGSVSCNNDDGGKIPTAPEPPKDKVVKPEDLAKVPAKEEADKPVVVVDPKKDPCPFVEKKLLRTVTGPWKRGATTVRHITYHGTTVAWADVVWTRDVFNVFAVSHCTLLKGHGGAHKMGPVTEVKEKYATFTEKVTYGVGEAQVPPKPHPADSLPEE